MAKKRIAINGFGRIGRIVLRIYLTQPELFDFEVVMVNTPGDPESVRYLLTYDSTHGVFEKQLTLDGSYLCVDQRRIVLTQQKEVNEDFWQRYEIDWVMDCSGICRDKEAAMKHIHAGAKKVLLASPAKQVDKTIVFGVNQHTLDPRDQVISCASCTTNCLAPIASILHKAYGIESGFMTTVHAYTSDQALVDRRHKDFRRGRSAGQSIVPTSTGAANSIGLILPELQGKLKCYALRVPTENVSLLDLNVNLSKSIESEQINQLMQHHSQTDYRGIVEVNTQPLVSVDFLQSPASAIFDATQTEVYDRTAKIVAWYDNEWGYASRMLDMAQYIQESELAHV